MTALLTPQDLADALKVSVNSVYYWAARREIPFLRVGRHLRFDLDAVMTSFAERTAARERPCPLSGPSLKPKPSRSLKIKDAGRSEPPDKEA